MTTAAEELEAAALALPKQERAELAKRLIASLEEDEVETAWQDEVRRRLRAYRAHQTGSKPAEEVLREARGHTAT